MSKIHSALQEKILAEPDKKYEILVRIPIEFKLTVDFEKHIVEKMLQAIGFWNRLFGGIVFIDVIDASNIDLFYVVMEIKGKLIYLIEELPEVEWISENLEVSAPPLDLPEDGVPLPGIVGPMIVDTIPFLGFDKIHKDPRFIAKGLGKDGPPAGIADTGVSTSSGGKWTWLYENPEDLQTGKLGQYRILEAKNFTYEAWNPNLNGVGHGSHIANMMASAGNKYYGAVPQGRLYVAKVLDSNGSGLVSWIIKGINWLVGRGCKVINLSLGSETQSDGTDELCVACDAAWDKGVYVSIAAGNSGKGVAPFCEGTLGSPASSKKCVIAGATSGAKSTPEEVQKWSSRPPTLDGRKKELKYIVAPGLKIKGYDLRMSDKSGTSFAAPWDSATAWSIFIIHPDWTNDMVWEAIKSTAKPLGYKDAYGEDEGFCLEGYGRLDAWAAFNWSPETPPAECKEGDVEIIEMCPDKTWMRRRVCVAGKWKEEIQPCATPPSETVKAVVTVEISTNKGQSWSAVWTGKEEGILVRVTSKGSK